MSKKTVYIEPDAVAKTCAATTLSSMQDRGLREELARALHPIEAVSFDQCDSVTQAIYRKVADGLLPIIELARAEERERCAHIVESINLGNVAMPDLPSLKGVPQQVQWGLLSEFALLAREKIAAAIRGLK